jgi:CBS domain containing-hemolysin-like protein
LPTDTSKSSNEEIDGYREVVGLVTLENVIERILLIDIHDEKDREAAHKLL